MGTRTSGRDPSTYTLRELGRGFTAAPSTCAVAAMNRGLAFMALLSYSAAGAKGTWRSTLPCGGIIRIRFEGSALTRSDDASDQDPYVARENLLQAVCLG